MSDSVFLDFETYSACNLRACGTSAYAQHASTQVILARYAWNNEPPQPLHPDQPLPLQLAAFWRDGVGFTWAWNAFFEQLICLRAWPAAWDVRCKPTRWQCSMALAASCGLPLALGNCAKWLFPKDVSKQKDSRGYRLIQLCCIPDKEGKRPILSKELYKELGDYCTQDVVAERAIHHALPVRCLSPMERAVWALDQRINLRGFQVDLPLVRGALKLADRETLRINRTLATLTKGVVTTAKQNQKLVAYCQSKGVEIDNMRADTVLWTLREKGINKRARQVLRLRQEGSLQSLRKLPPLLRVSVDGRACGMLQYHGAHTGRWAGRMFQPHNLTKPKRQLGHLIPVLRDADADLIRTMSGPVNHVIRDSMRHVIVAKPGHILVAVDVNAIEARVAGWVANDAHYNNAFRDNLDLYRLTASPIFKIPYEDIANPSFERDFGKKCALGLQYQMWWKTFWATCVKEGLNVTRSLCERAVEIYRKTAPGICSAWKLIEKMVKKAIQQPGEMICPSEHLAKIRIYAVVQNDYLCIHLPSDRILRYPRPSLRTVQRTSEDGRTYEKIQPVYWRAGSKGVYPVSTYGGKLFENCVQAIARDILASAMLQIDPIHPLVLSVHDEAVAEVPIADADKALAHMQQWMSTAPAWAPGLTLKAGGFISEYYRK